MRVFIQRLETGDDIFVVRQRARRLAELLGFDELDQVRIATALSEVARDLIGDDHGSGMVSFSVAGEPQAFVIVVDGLSDAADVGLASARRLMRRMELATHAAGRRLTMSRLLPRPLAPTRIAELETTITQQTMSSPLDELRNQNRELVATLEALSAEQQQLVDLNAELRETNRGVVAMYTELAVELESTNQGVVALYAELDDAALLLRRASEAKTRFLANVSHELRTPVTSIIGLSRLLLDGETDRQREVELINTSAHEMFGLVCELLDLAKAESGRLSPVTEVVDLGRVVTDLADLLRPIARHGVDLVVEVRQPQLQVEADPALLRHAIRNLIANALAFTTHGRVLVAVDRTLTGIDITVADTGIGIAEEHVERIFEEFFQVSGPQQTTRKGTGLGLAYAKAVIEAHGGSIAVSSAPGTGSTFTVHLVSATADPGDPAAASVRLRPEPGAVR